MFGVQMSDNFVAAMRLFCKNMKLRKEYKGYRKKNERSGLEVT